MKTIDEAINILKSDNDYNKSIGCDTSYEEQIAEWLEELKSYRASVFSGDMTKSMLKEERNKAVDDFADYLRMSYDKGMRLSVAMCKNEVEKFKLKALYSRFINAIDDCVKAFNEMEQLKAGER